MARFKPKLPVAKYTPYYQPAWRSYCARQIQARLDLLEREHEGDGGVGGSERAGGEWGKYWARLKRASDCASSCLRWLWTQAGR